MSKTIISFSVFALQIVVGCSLPSSKQLINDESRDDQMISSINTVEGKKYFLILSSGRYLYLAAASGVEDSDNFHINDCVHVEGRWEPLDRAEKDYLRSLIPQTSKPTPLAEPSILFKGSDSPDFTAEIQLRQDSKFVIDRMSKSSQ